MGLMAKQSGVQYEPIPEGMHKAICYGVIDIGTQHNPMYDNHTHKVIIIFEMPDARINIEGEDKPRAISKEYTLSLHAKSVLRKDMESWRGKKFKDEELEGYDLKKLLGIPANLQVMHQKSKKSGNLYHTIETIIPVDGKVTKVKTENTYLFFSFEEAFEEGVVSLPENTPEWIQHKIEESLEWKSIKNGTTQENPLGDDFPLEPVDDDDVPF